MMPDSDFNSMQRNAINYAREMQRRANEQGSCNQKTNASPPINEKSYGETPFCMNACPVKNILSSNKSGEADSDILTLMAILLLLASDGGDRMLMLALLYIMT